MASARDNTDFLYQTPDLVNPLYKSTKRVHNIVHIAEFAGIGVGILSNAALFGSGVLRNLDKEELTLKSAWKHGSANVEKYNMLPVGLSALTAGGIALAYGKNYEEKLQGASLGAAEFVSERLAKHAGEYILNNFFEENIAKNNTIRWAAREIGGTVIGAALIPAFNFVFKTIGKEIDKATAPKYETLSPHHPQIRRKVHLRDGNTPNEGKFRSKTNIEDERPSKREVEEALARRIVHGRAF